MNQTSKSKMKARKQSKLVRERSEKGFRIPLPQRSQMLSAAIVSGKDGVTACLSVSVSGPVCGGHFAGCQCADEFSLRQGQLQAGLVELRPLLDRAVDGLTRSLLRAMIAELDRKLAVVNPFQGKVKKS